MYHNNPSVTTVLQHPSVTTVLQHPSVTTVLQNPSVTTVSQQSLSNYYITTVYICYVVDSFPRARGRCLRSDDNPVTEWYENIAGSPVRRLLRKCSHDFKLRPVDIPSHYFQYTVNQQQQKL